GFNGNLDPTGWQLTTAPDQKPRFVRVGGDGKSEVRNQKSEIRSQGSYAPRDPGDENWDDRFYSSGLDGPVYAVAVSGSNVYVGGRFSSVSRLTVNGIARWDSISSQWFA